MGYFVYLLFFVVYVGEYLFQKTGVTLKVLAILPEMISVAVGICVLLYFALYRKIKMRPSYFYFYVAFALHILIGVIGNQVQPLAVLAGLRAYLKFLPLYFLPMVYNMTDEKVKAHLLALIAIAVMQFPLAVYQRFVEYGHLATGDYVAGTLTAAPMLTLFLVCTISVLVAFYVKKRIGLNIFIILIFILFLPAAINETKATVILLPLAILFPVVFGARKDFRVKIIATVIPAAILMVISFNYLYKIMYSAQPDVVEFYTTEKVTEYLYTGAEPGQVSGENTDQVGRLDSILYAYEKNADDIFTMMWGVGIGNAAVSFSKKFEGEYADEYRRLGGKQTGLGHYIWEIGLLGLCHIIWFCFLIFRDALKLKEQEDLSGPIGLGWLGVLAILITSMPYQNMIAANELMYPFFYISGFIVAKRYIIERTVIEFP